LCTRSISVKTSFKGVFFFCVLIKKLTILYICCKV
jgi:hypothetical protein